jgi:methyl-accepting chemotaxis protein
MRIWQKMSLGAKLIVPVSMVTIIGMSGIVYYVKHASQKEMLKGSIASAVNTIGQYKTLRAYYTKNVVGPVKQSSDMKIHYEHAGRSDTIPLPATMIHDLAEEFAKREDGLQLKLYSQFPFPNRAGRKLDSFAREALEVLNKDRKRVFTKVEEVGGQEVVRVAIADNLVADACVNCHNSHPQTTAR